MHPAIFYAFLAARWAAFFVALTRPSQPARCQTNCRKEPICCRSHAFELQENRCLHKLQAPNYVSFDTKRKTTPDVGVTPDLSRASERSALSELDSRFHPIYSGYEALADLRRKTCQPRAFEDG